MEIFSRLASDDVNDCEHDDPDNVHEMPIEAQHMHTFGMFLRDRTGYRERHHYQQCHQSNNDVRRVQTHKRVESCAEQVRLDCETFVVDQVLPLPARSKQEITSQGHSHKPPEAEAL